MELPEAVQISKQIQQDLVKHTKNPKVSQEIINGTGFRFLNFGKDFINATVPKDYLQSMHLKPTIKQKLTQFCMILPDVQKLKWKKFQCLFQDNNFNGSWIGVYYRQIQNEQCQFISNYMKCSFKLMPDIYVLRTEEEGGFLMFKNRQTNILIVQKERGFSRQDYRAIMNICSSVSNTRYALQ